MEDSQLKILKSFFKNIWKPNHYEETLIEQVNELKPRSVLDVGCGYNPYKGKIQNLYGIDIANQAADRVCDILDFHSQDKFDVVLALGSLNFGNDDDILDRLKHIRTLITDRGKFFVRVNPGIPWPDEPSLKIYPWTKEKILNFGLQSGFTIDGEIEEVATTRGTRVKFIYLPVNNDKKTN